MPRTPGSPEWHARVDELRVVRARGMLGAIEQAHRLRINPGGQVRGIKLPAGRERDLPVNRLLSIADIEEGGSRTPRSP